MLKSGAPCWLNIFLEQTVIDVLDSFEGTIEAGGRTITNLSFADDIDLLVDLEAN